MEEFVQYKFETSIYELRLNQAVISDNDWWEEDVAPLTILRVPGGWIYYNTHLGSNGVFVPFDNEFMKRSK